MTFLGQHRAPDPPSPDYHPAQVELLYERKRIIDALAEVDACLAVFGNLPERRAIRDALLDIRSALTRETVHL